MGMTVKELIDKLKQMPQDVHVYAEGELADKVIFEKSPDGDGGIVRIFKAWNVSFSKAALEYAISSLKTDEAYQIMYEGGEIFTKADLEAILVEIQLEIEELRLDRPLMSRGYECYGFEDKTPSEIRQECSKIIQQKINALKEQEDDKV